MSGDGGNSGHAGSRDAGDASLSEGNVVVMIKDVEENLSRQMESRHADLTKRIDDLVAVVSSISARCPVRGTSSRRRSAENRKRKEPPSADQLPYFAEMMGVDPATFVLNWSILVTLLSVGQKHESVLTWVPPYAQTYMDNFRSEMQGVSALSVLFFSVEPNHLYSRYHESVGKMWSIVLRASMESFILRTRSLSFARTRLDGEPIAAKAGTIQKPAEPGWIRAFGGKKSTYKAVAEVVSCLETTYAMAKEIGNADYLARWKSIKMENVPGAAPFELESDWYVRQMRSKMLRDLSYGRSEARAKLIGKLMFVVEKIVGDFGTVDEATSAGFEVQFHEATNPEENDVPDDLTSGIWCIPVAKISGGSEDQISLHNNGALQQLSLRFPSLQATIKYKREILSGSDHRDLPKFYDVSEVVSFHDVALTILTAATRSSSVQETLRISPLSVRAVHFLAFGIRGLVKSTLKTPLSELEKLAMGNIKHAEVNRRSGDWATTNIADGSEPGKEKDYGAVTVQMLRDSKLEMSVTDYLIANPVGVERTAEGSVHSEGAQMEEEHDFDEDWFNTDAGVVSNVQAS